MQSQGGGVRARWALVAFAGFATIAGAGADVPGGKGGSTARRAVGLVAPDLPGPVVKAMQEGRYGEAATALERSIAGAKSAGDRSYFRFLRGVAERLGGRPDAARATLAEALEAEPKGPWASKIRFELAGVELAAGRSAAAETLARAEAEVLLAPERKDRLAGVYRAFADRLLRPDDPVTPPDPVAAHGLLAKARDLAKGEALRASLLLAMGRAGQAIPLSSGMPGPQPAPGPQPSPVRDFQDYLREYPRGADRDLVRFHLGEAQLALGAPAVARLTWTDLVRDLDARAPGGLSADLVELKARSLYRAAKTFGVPDPADDARLNLGVAALRRFLVAAPAHPMAVRAAYEIGASYLARGQGEPALAAFDAFLKGTGFRAETDEARRDLADLTMAATYQIARTLQGQGRFEPAIEAYRGYLARFPNGPQSADAQRAILDAQLQIAAEALAGEKFAEARAAWSAFVLANPLDARVPQILYDAGASFAAEKKFDEAVAAWDALISKFPDSPPASGAQFEAASIIEVEKGDPAAAIERFRKVALDPWKSRAAQRVAVMEAKALTVVSPRAFRSGEPAQLRVTTRNLETLTFSAYKLNAEAYFRKKHALGDVQSLDIGLVAPDAEWTAPVPGYGKFKPVASTFDLKIPVPGVYVVKVSDEKSLQATALVVGSDLDAIVKVSREQVLVFAQDMKTGKGRKGARVLVADGSGVILEKATGEDGVLLTGWDRPTPPAGGLHYLVLDGPDAAGSGLAVPDKVAQGLSPRAYIYTDRPAYRPGQEVALRGVVREAKDGQYANPAGEAYKLEVYDAKGRLLLAKGATLSPFGTFHESVRLDPGAPVGAYRVRLHRPGRSDFSGGFEVQSYRLEKLHLEFDLPRAVYYRGEVVKAGAIARYQYGAPATNRPIEVALPDGRTVRGVTDGSGKFAFEFPTEGFAEEQALRLVARLPGDNVAAAARVMVAVRGFGIDLTTPREVYLDGETFALAATTLDALGQPTGRELRVAVLKVVTQGRKVTEREVSHAVLATDKETGQGRLTLKVEDRDGGSFLVRAAGTDQFGNPIVADRPLTISGRADAERLRILTDRQAFKVGETATVNLHGRGQPGTALLAWEADRVLQYRLVAVGEGDNPVSWPVEGAQFPNFTLTAARMTGRAFDQARLDVRVERDLRVTLQPRKPAVGPGEEVEVDVTTVDQLGKPVAAEVAMALVDRSLLRLFDDKMPPIGRYFHDQARTGAFATEATNTFRDEPATRPVSDAVVEEAERQLAQTRNDASRGEVRDAAKSMEVFNAVPAPDPAPFRTNDGLGPTSPAERAPSATEARALGLLGEDRSRGEPSGQPGAGLGMIANKKKAAKLGLDLSPADAAFADQSFADIESGDAPTARRPGGMAFRSELASRADQPAAPPRERFAETAYWNPGVVTDGAGKATVKFRAPMALSEYRFSARGVTGSETLVGQAGATLAVRKDFFVDLKTPAGLIQGDRPRFVARVHHVGVPGPVVLSLTAYAGDRQQVFPRTINLQGDGVDEVTFEPFEVPDGDVVRLTLAAKAGEKGDELVVEVPIRPWGVQAVASASGTASDDATVFVGLPPGRPYESPELRIDLAPTLRRLLVELALGQESSFELMAPSRRICKPIPADTTADRASDLLAAASALRYLQDARKTEAPEAGRLADRVRGLVAELITAQGDDGGWPFIAPRAGQARPASHRMASAHVARALRAARDLGMMTEPSTVDKASTYLAGEFNRAGGDNEARAALLDALAGFDRATFEQANTLNRARQGLTDVSLAYLALTLHRLDRDPLAGEVLDVLGPRARTEPVAVGAKPRKFWTGPAQSQWHRGSAETTALAALAFAQVRPGAPEVEAASEWLLAHRQGNGWAPRKATGPAVAALAAYYGKAREADDRYRLVVSVNDVEVTRFEVAGPAEGRSILVPRKLLKVRAENKVRFAVEGRGTFGYSATMTGFARDFGPEQKTDGKSFQIQDRLYLPADPELDGKALPTGFGVAVNPTPFANRITQVIQGGRARVRIEAGPTSAVGNPARSREFHVVEETLPAGVSLIEGSVQTSASSYALVDNSLTFYFAPESGLGRIQYDVAGYLPGTYRALPAQVRAAYEPAVVQMGSPGELRVLGPGEAATDPYRATPDELFARGKALAQLGRLAEAAGPLEELFAGYTPRDDVARDAARILLTAHIKDYQPRKVVQDFEILKEKGPELVVPFDEVLVVGRAYRDIGEHERAYLVFRAIVEASYLEDAQVGEVLRRRGQALEAIAYQLDLWRESPNTAAIEADFFGLAQVVALAAGQAATNPALRREMLDAEVTRPELLLQAIRLIRVLLASSPKNPLADEASLALVGAFLELEDHETVVALAPGYAKLYPRSTFLDSFQYGEALGRFQLGQYDRAIEVAAAIARATYKDGNGLDQASPNKWQALYILGQIHDARRQPAQAVAYYQQVADRFADATGALKSLTRKGLKLPEVTVIRPKAAPDGPAGTRPRDPSRPRSTYPDRLELGYRNIAEVDLKVYPVDLMRLYLTRRNLDAIAGIDLAGITPLHESTVKLGDGLDFAEKARGLDLPLTKEGAYLVMARGDDLYASGIVLVTPLELDVLEEPESGRVRAEVRDDRTGDPVAKVQVKVIGSDNPAFFTGRTDLRGVFAAEGVNGQVTAVARAGAGQYAFYRGVARVGSPPVAPTSEPASAPAKPQASGESLDQNLKSLNSSNQLRSIDRLQNRFGGGRKGIRAEEAR